MPPVGLRTGRVRKWRLVERGEVTLGLWWGRGEGVCVCVRVHTCVVRRKSQESKPWEREIRING